MSMTGKNLIPAPFVNDAFTVFHKHSISYVLCIFNAILTLALFGRY